MEAVFPVDGVLVSLARCLRVVNEVPARDVAIVFADTICPYAKLPPEKVCTQRAEEAERGWCDRISGPADC